MATDLITADEFLARPGDHRWEQLIAGAIVVSQPKPPHQIVLTELTIALGLWVRGDGGFGEAVLPIDVKLDDFNVYAPDQLWYADRASLEGVYPYPIPQLAVEVRSPSTWRYDLHTKKRVYDAHGLPELWLVDTESRSVLVYRRSKAALETFDVELEFAAGETLTSPQLPGFALAIDALFARL